MTPIKYLFKTLKDSLKGINEIRKNPKLLLPGIIVSIIWFILSLLVSKGNNSKIVYIASIISFAQGGMYGGLIGTIGGIIGKGILACFITKIFIKKDKKQFEKIILEDKLFILLGVGMGLIVYNFLSSNASLTNAVIGVTLCVSIFKKMKNPTDFWYGFLPTFNTKINRGMVKSVLVGLSLGLVCGVGISCIKISGNYIPYIVGVIAIVSFIIFKIIKNKKAVIALFTIFSIIIPIKLVLAFDYGSVLGGLKIDYKINGVEITDTKSETLKYNSDKNIPRYREVIYGTCHNGTVSVHASVKNLIEDPEDWNDWIEHSVNVGLNFHSYLVTPDGIFSKTPVEGSNKSTTDMPFQMKDFDHKIKVESKNKSISVMISVQVKTTQKVLFEKQILGIFENLDYVGEDDSKIPPIIDSNIDITFDNGIIIYDINGDAHLSEKDTIVVSVLSVLSAILGVSFSIGFNIGGFNNSICGDEYREITDPASGAVTGYKLNKETNEWVSIDGSSILDPDKLDEWYKNRQSDKEWMDEQRNKETSIHKDIITENQKDKEKLKNQEEEIARKEKEFRDFKYELARFNRDYYSKAAKKYEDKGNALRTAEVSAIVASAVADAAIDVYGVTNPAFAKKYKLIKGALTGAAENGFSGLVSGTINGGADALLVGKKGMAGKAIVRFSSRMVTGTANSILKGKTLSEGLKSGMTDGVLHAGAGAIMDSATGKLVKLDSNVWKSTTVLTKDSVKVLGKELLGKTHGGLQRTLVRGANNLFVKPFVKGK